MPIKLDPSKQRELERCMYFLHNDLVQNKDDLELKRFIEISIQAFEASFDVKTDLSKPPPPPFLTEEDEGRDVSEEFEISDKDVGGPFNVNAAEKKGTAMINVKKNSKTTLKKDVKTTGKTNNKATVKEDVKASTTKVKKDDKTAIKKTDNPTGKKGGPINIIKNKKDNQKKDDDDEDDPDDGFFKRPDCIPRGISTTIKIKGPHRGEQYNLKANDLYFKGKYQQALAHYTKAIGVNANEPMYFYNRGMIHFRLGDYEKCIEDCLEAVRLDSRYSKSYACAGKAYYLTNQLRSAVRCFSAALQLDPTNAAFQKHFKLVQAKLLENFERKEEAETAKLQAKDAEPLEKAAISPVNAAKPQIKPVVEDSESTEEQYEGEGLYEEEDEYEEVEYEEEDEYL